MFEDILNNDKYQDLTDEEFKMAYCAICIDVDDCRTGFIKHCRKKDPEKLKMYLRGDHV
jgi:hypothetical protein